MPYTGKVLAGAILLACLLCPCGGARSDEFKVTPVISVAQEYNDNILYSTVGTQRDFVTVLSPGLQIVERTARLDTAISGRLDRRLYHRYSELNATDQFYEGRGSYRVTERATVSGSAAYTKDSDPDRDLGTTGISLTNVKRTRQSYSAAGNHLLSQITAASLTYSYQNDDYESDRYTDIESHSMGLGLVHDMGGLVPLTKTLGQVGYDRYNMLDLKVDNFTMMAGIAKDLNEKWNIQLSGGTRYTRSDFVVLTSPTGVATDERSSGWGWIAHVALDFKGQRDKVQITAMHNLSPASGRSGASERTSLTMSASRRFTGELYGTLSAGYHINRSNEGEFSTQKIDEDSFTVRPGIRYDHSQNVSAALSYAYSTTRYNVSRTTAEQNLFMLRFTFRRNIIE